MRPSLLLLLVAAAAARPAYAAEAAPLRLAVLDLDANDTVAPGVLRTLDELMLAEAQRGGLLQVLGMSDLRAVLGLERQRQLLGCDSGECLAELGGALGVDRILAGSIGRVGDAYYLNMKLIRATTAVVDARAGREVRGGEAELVDAVRGAVRELIDPLVTSPPFYKRWWFWTAVGAVVVGGSAAWALRPEDRRGVATFDFGAAR
jgi:hypothetical protein